ncbi:MAG: FitA-like ribbon-helix-helix domain-containing protein [Candidatus Rokuibacteriota bacterium]
MPALHVRDLDDAVIAALKARASRRHRSLQGEVRSILERAVGGERRAAKGSRRRLRLHTVRVGRPSSFSREVIYEDGDR